jgi:hypothetical protein
MENLEMYQYRIKRKNPMKLNKWTVTVVVYAKSEEEGLELVKKIPYFHRVLEYIGKLPLDVCGEVNSRHGDTWDLLFSEEEGG